MILLFCKVYASNFAICAKNSWGNCQKFIDNFPRLCYKYLVSNTQGIGQMV